MAGKVINTPRLDPLPEESNEKKTILGSSNNKKNQSNAQQKILSSTPSFDNLKAFVSTVLAGNDSEEVLTTLVDKILKEEQMALTPETKNTARMKKILLGRALTDVVAYGDQQGMLYLLSDKLGYKKKY